MKKMRFLNKQKFKRIIDRFHAQCEANLIQIRFWKVGIKNHCTPLLFPLDTDFLGTKLIPFFSQQVMKTLFDGATRERIIKEADSNCEHYFDLLGSGEIRLGNPVHWHQDFFTGYEYNPKKYYKFFRPAKYPGGVDIKNVWELNRCYHFTRLGQAYWLTGEEKYEREFTTAIQNWTEKNPWPLGVNWAEKMEAAIRLINWLWGFAFFHKNLIQNENFCRKFFQQIELHCMHIKNNLPVANLERNNHHLAALLGIIYTAICCPFFRDSDEWVRFGLSEFWKTVELQFGDDGANFEGSIAYHRLTLEMILHAVMLCKKGNRDIPERIIHLVEKMIDFIQWCTKPDGTVASIGDADNGRVIKLSAWRLKEREWNDYRYLLAIGSFLFPHRQDFKISAEDERQEAIWWFGDLKKDQIYRDGHSETDKQSKNFPQGGYAVIKNEDVHITIRYHTPNNHRGHIHNDHMSYEFHSNGINWIVDSGTFTYTKDYHSRNYFRSSTAHNIAIVDEQEINPINKKTAFYIENLCKPKIIHWETNASFDALIGEHQLDLKTERRLISKRLFFLDKREKKLIVMDFYKNIKKHQFVNNIIISNGIEVIKTDDSFQLKEININKNIFIYAKPGYCLWISKPTKISKSYGIIEEGKSIRLFYENGCRDFCMYYILSNEKINKEQVESLLVKAEILKKDHA